MFDHFESSLTFVTRNSPGSRGMAYDAAIKEIRGGIPSVAILMDKLSGESRGCRLRRDTEQGRGREGHR